MQILLVASFKIALFTSKHTITNIMSGHMPSADEPIPVPKNQLVRIHVIALV